jgi:hypothetical protein
VCGRCDGVGVGCQIVKFCGLIVRTLRHSVPLTCMMQTVRPGATKIDRCRPSASQGSDLRTWEAPESSDQDYWKVAANRPGYKGFTFLVCPVSGQVLNDEASRK